MALETPQASAPAEAAPVTAESLAGLYEAEIKAEREPPKPKAVAKAEPEPAAEAETETEPTETAPEEAAETEITTEEVEAEEEAEPEGESEGTHAQRAIDAPNGMSEADKAMFSKLPHDLKSWISGREAQQTADYTRKTMEVAEHRKAIQAASGALMAKHQQVDQFLSQFTDQPLNPPDPRLAGADPDEYQRQLAEYVHRKDLQEKAQVVRARNAEELSRQQQAAMQEVSAHEAQELERLAPELAAKTPKAAEMRKAIHRYGVEQGYTPEMLSQASARDVVTLWKAQQFDAAQKAKANVKTVPKPAPKIASPGPAKGGRPSNYARAVENLRTNHSVDALQEAFLAELQAEKRS